jgi:hypothetical protein
VPVPGSGKELVAFYTTGDGLTPEQLRTRLTEVLPAGYVPGRLYEIAALPLTANGKVDKRALIQRAADELAQHAPAADPPATPTEERVAEVWATVLDLPLTRISRTDDFFTLGGSSLRMLRMVAALDGLVTLADVIADPVLSALAAAADQRQGVSA